MKRRNPDGSTRPAIAVAAGILLALALPLAGIAQIRFEVTFPASLRSEPLTGRLIVIAARKDTPEPRLAMSPYGSPLFGIDLAGLRPGEVAAVDEGAVGYPMASLKDLPAGDYFVQAVINVYDECRRSDGKTVWVHMDTSPGASLNVSPGNLYGGVVKARLDPAVRSTVRLTIDRVIPAEGLPADTDWLKRVWIKSEKLTAFWGRPVFFGATVLLPKGYDEHPGVRYPAVYAHEHGVPFSFNPDPASHKRAESGARAANLQTGYEFFQSWTSEGFPRFIAVTFHQPTPFFPSSYSVNSANCGPWGDALLEELIPHLEARFRILARPYARLVEGASTGGWEALALELYHPDVFGGAWVFNPDPIDFRRYQLVNIYQDDNAFEVPAYEWRPAERPFRRTTEGQVVDTVRSMSRFEAVLGTKGRGGYQFGGWEAVFGPADAEGYPAPLWDKLTGKIDRKVAEYMREHGFDLRDYAARNWAALGPKLEGKLNFFAGDMDNFHLNLAVYLFEDFLKGTKEPHVAGRFEYGRPMKGHSWHKFDWAEMLREMAGHVTKNAPAGEDTRAWKY